LIIHNKYRIAGGEDICAAAQADLLRAKGHEVRVYEKENTSIDSFGLLRKVRLFFETTHNPAVAEEVAQVARDFKPASALIHNTLPLISPGVYAPLKSAGVRVIQWLHNYRLVCPAGTLFRNGKPCTLCVDGGLQHAAKYKCWTGSMPATLALNRMLERHRKAGTWLKQVDRFVALNSYMRELLVSKGVVPADKISVQPNFIHVQVAPGEGEGQGFVFAGRLTPEKGLRTLLEAQKMAGVPLKIIGEDPSEWRESAGPGVSFLGHVPREQLLAEVAASRALVFASEWPEGCPGVIQEAMALGRAVIASRVAGSAELIRDGENGLIYEPGDAQALAERLQALQKYGHRAAELGQQGLKDYQERFTPEAGYASLVKLMKL